MSARHIVALLRSHVDGDTQQFYATALQVAASEERAGHVNVARELHNLILKGKSKVDLSVRLVDEPTGIAQPRGDLAPLLALDYPTTRFGSMVLAPRVRSRIDRFLLEQTQFSRLRANGLHPRRKLLLTGPPGSGKTMTAAAIAGELKMPLFTIRFEGLISRYLGSTAKKLQEIFDAMPQKRGVYFFDEFDAIGSKRDADNDVGEIRRVLNSFLQLLENDRSQSVIVCATNHPNLLDQALFRRFDDLIAYEIPSVSDSERLLRERLALFDTAALDYHAIAIAARGLSQADIVKIADEAAKSAVLNGTKAISENDLITEVEVRLRDEC